MIWTAEKRHCWQADDSQRGSSKSTGSFDLKQCLVLSTLGSYLATEEEISPVGLSVLMWEGIRMQVPFLDSEGLFPHLSNIGQGSANVFLKDQIVDVLGFAAIWSLL